MINQNILKESIERLYCSQDFLSFMKTVNATIKEYRMLEAFSSGVYLGFSGGPDSVMALLVMLYLKKDYPFSLACVHIEHGIRGLESIEDMEFSRQLADALCVPFYSYKVDVPKYASEKSISIELAAREMRYSAFYEFSRANPEYKTIALAHNSTDNLETVIFNLTRGAGSLGISGINPMRDNIIRPLIGNSKAEIIALLDRFSIPYAVDSTNADNLYTRNFIRNNIIPLLKELNPAAEKTVLRAGKNLREDDDCLDCISRELFDKNYHEGKASRDWLLTLHSSIFARVICLMVKEITDVMPQRIHIKLIANRLRESGNFSLDINSSLSFVARDGECYIIRSGDALAQKAQRNNVALNIGVNYLPDYNAVIYISDKKDDVFSLNVYNFSIQVGIPDDIIDGEIYVRQKRDGDSYRYGGMTHKVKRMFSDKKIPQKQRETYPILCDSNGVLYVPGFSYRGAGEAQYTCKKTWISVFLFDDYPADLT